ncbi:hypothetical protein AA0472_2097 [Acetobacter estunensis NRIC 0472]|nr:hypothetical protein AA0472_2097 [Acetobacter estunensis NRIC 0472]
MAGRDEWLNLALNPQCDARASNGGIKCCPLIIEGQWTGYGYGEPDAVFAEFPVVQGIMPRPAKTDTEMIAELTRMEWHPVLIDVRRSSNGDLPQAGLKRESNNILIQHLPKPYAYVEPFLYNVHASIVDLHLDADPRETSDNIG